MSVRSVRRLRPAVGRLRSLSTDTPALYFFRPPSLSSWPGFPYTTSTVEPDSRQSDLDLLRIHNMYADPLPLPSRGDPSTSDLLTRHRRIDSTTPLSGNRIHKLSAPVPERDRVSHYTNVFQAFENPFGNTHRAPGDPGPGPVSLAGIVYSNPRRAYAQMRLFLTGMDQAALIKPVLRTFVSLEDYAAARVALHAFTKVPTTQKQRRSAKAAVLNIFVRRIYFSRGKAQVRRSAQVLFARMSAVGWGLNEMVASTYFWTPDRLEQVMRLRFAENDLRPLAFLLGQALQLHRGNKKLDGVNEQARAVHEMEGPLREHRRKAVERKRQRLEAQSVSVDWHSDSKPTLAALRDLLIRR